MNSDLLVRMANEIGAFFDGEVGEETPQAVLAHIKRYWDPRMRVRIVEHLRAGGAGLTEHARAAIELLARETSENRSSPRD